MTLHFDEAKGGYTRIPAGLVMSGRLGMKECHRCGACCKTKGRVPIAKGRDDVELPIRNIENDRARLEKHRVDVDKVIAHIREHEEIPKRSEVGRGIVQSPKSRSLLVSEE